MSARALNQIIDALIEYNGVRRMEKTVTLAQGAGGKQTSELIEQIFAKYFSNPLSKASNISL